ncbi:alpha/beta hydrolase [Nocardia gipuzkoensis]|uniref:alpha/beta fold hydrolase n=1 Tax=Nocardia gipuzkoensis TaxID=2749991 RepID=UPI001E38A19A|nr:alpha/beta hydrolase [Nocardia gipuzkoensis]UGT70303.1 alpha/beta hydrolase [Nocardia gipuzkoensis]
MSTISTGTIEVSGADLYYEIRGSGPMLLIAQSGEGDARRSGDLVEQLAKRFTVLTYDRRGLSRSTPRDPAVSASVATHADDVYRLLDAVTDEPVRMLGCSMGAAIGLHLAVRRPDRLHTLIAHEPVTPWLLAAADRAAQLGELEHCQRVFAAQGWRAALAPMVRTLGIDPENQEREPGVTAPPLGPDRAANFEYFLGHDFTAIREDHLDVAALWRSPVRIVPACGRTTARQVFDYKCAHELAALRGVPVVEFPGGHNGNLTHPAGYATRVCEVLDEPECSR